MRVYILFWAKFEYFTPYLGIQDHPEQGCKAPSKNKENSWLKCTTKHIFLYPKSMNIFALQEMNAGCPCMKCHLLYLPNLSNTVPILYHLPLPLTILGWSYSTYQSWFSVVTAALNSTWFFPLRLSQSLTAPKTPQATFQGTVYLSQVLYYKTWFKWLKLYNQSGIHALWHIILKGLGHRFDIHDP